METILTIMQNYCKQLKMFTIWWLFYNCYARILRWICGARALWYLPLSRDSVIYCLPYSSNICSNIYFLSSLNLYYKASQKSLLNWRSQGQIHLMSGVPWDQSCWFGGLDASALIDISQKGRDWWWMVVLRCKGRQRRRKWFLSRNVTPWPHASCMV